MLAETGIDEAHSQGAGADERLFLHVVSRLAAIWPSSACPQTAKVRASGLGGVDFAAQTSGKSG